ncbi:MAG: CRTAC1 family protein [Thermoanaerobaculia bacterium]|nr:CRTAC1 family protein [Thermoanaerobaculia bacterium]
MPSSRVRWSLLACLSFAVPLGAAAPSREQVRAEFAAVCREQVSGDHPFFGTAQLAQLEARRRRPGVTPLEEVRLLGVLGREQIRVGRLEAARESFEAARKRVAELAGEVSDLRFQLTFDLALTHLLLAEAGNCIAAHTADSCILPLAPEGRHRDPAPARRAAELFAEALGVRPGHGQARWLQTVARLVAGGDPSAALAARPWARSAAPGRWRDRAPELGVAARDLSGGAVMDDFDGDGRLDLVSTTWDPCGPMKAFRNDGRGGFEDVTEAWGLAVQLGGLALLQADYEGDGDLDLLVLRGAWLGARGVIRNSLLRNDLRTGGGFVDTTADAGLAWPAYPTQAAAWADYDRDGDLDLYIGNESPAGNPTVAGFVYETGRGYPSQLFRNNGDGTFVDVARGAGVQNFEFAKAAVWGDVDDDGDPDLFVSNIGPDRLYWNQGDGTFVEGAAAAGLGDSPRISFAAWFFDFDNDGRLDLWVNDYGTPFERVTAGLLGEEVGTEGAPALYRNVGGGRFARLPASAGLDHPALPMGANFGDLEADGFEDVYLGTGVPDLSALMPNVMLRNRAGTSFEDVTWAGGFGHLQKGHGIAWGDLDDDGDEDLFEQMGGAFPFDAYPNLLLENPTRGANWLTLELVDEGRNPFAIGARVEIRTRGPAGEQRSVHRQVGAGGSSGGTFGASSTRLEVGLGSAPTVVEILVRWPDGRRESFPGPALNGAYRLRRGTGTASPLNRLPIPLGAFSVDAAGHLHP